MFPRHHSTRGRLIPAESRTRRQDSSPTEGVAPGERAALSISRLSRVQGGVVPGLDQTRLAGVSPIGTLGRTLLLEFGRGSGRYGLDTVKVFQDETVILHRRTNPFDRDIWETTTLQLTPESLAEVLAAVEKHRMRDLNKVDDGGLLDGTQWVPWLQQGAREKSVYFNNSFPEEISSFAEDLDNVLKDAGSEKARWRPISDADTRRTQRGLWKNIKR